jgi:predicted HicB family RNase H-like nuclease
MAYVYTRMVTMQDRRMGELRVRGLPEDVHRKLKALAALAGLSINEYALQVIKAHVDQKGAKL